MTMSLVSLQLRLRQMGGHGWQSFSAVGDVLTISVFSSIGYFLIPIRCIG
jgi:hypothetical protein